MTDTEHSDIEASPAHALRVDAVSTGAVGAAVGALLGFVVVPGIGGPIGSVLGAVLGSGIGAANSHRR
jgi:hypothetical protein